MQDLISIFSEQGPRITSAMRQAELSYGAFFGNLSLWPITCSRTAAGHKIEGVEFVVVMEERCNAHDFNRYLYNDYEYAFDCALDLPSKKFKHIKYKDGNPHKRYPIPILHMRLDWECESALLLVGECSVHDSNLRTLFLQYAIGQLIYMVREVGCRYIISNDWQGMGIGDDLIAREDCYFQEELDEYSSIQKVFYELTHQSAGECRILFLFKEDIINCVRSSCVSYISTEERMTYVTRWFCMTVLTDFMKDIVKRMYTGKRLADDDLVALRKVLAYFLGDQVLGNGREAECVIERYSDLIEEIVDSREQICRSDQPALEDLTLYISWFGEIL